MSVDIRFEPDGPSGVVPEGISLVDAAKRLGFEIPDCGFCDAACAVQIIDGAALLSDLSDLEREKLSPVRLGAGERLACQCKVERSGEVVIRLVLESERARSAGEKTRDIRQEFNQLSFDRKIATLMQLEGIALTQAFDKITDASVSWGKKVFDTVMPDDAAKQADRDGPKKEKTA